jgi:hypothetical protein
MGNAEMHYLPPYSRLREKLNIKSINGELLASIKLEDIEDFIRSMLLAVPLDEEWYRRTYPDIDEAVSEGMVRNGRDHFIRDGYFEGRRPFEMTVDEEWYLAQHADIGTAVAEGRITSASDHFASHGYAEGRLPFGHV